MTFLVINTRRRGGEREKEHLGNPMISLKKPITIKRHLYAQQNLHSRPPCEA